MKKELYTDSDNKFRVEVVKESGENFGTANVSNAIYEVLDCLGGEVLVSKSLNSGISKVVDAPNNIDELEVFIDDSEMTMKRGLYWHRAYIYDLAGNKLPPIFNEEINIK